MSRMRHMALGLSVLALASAPFAAHAAEHGPSGNAVSSAAGESPSVRWTRRLQGLPFKVWETNLAFDPVAHRVVNQGGHVLRSPYRTAYPQSSYTYIYDPITNALRRSTAPYRPQRRCLVDLAYADAMQRVITGNGASWHGSLPQGQPAADYKSIVKGDSKGPWLYDTMADTWEDSRTRGEPWRTTPHSQLAYDPVHDAVVYLGGGRVRIYYPYRNINRSFAAPSAMQYRRSYGITALGRSGKILVFGGTQSEGYDGALSDSWIYDPGNNTWQDVTGTVQPPRGMPYADFLKLDLEFDPELGRALLLTVPFDTRPPCFNQWQDPELWSFDPASANWSLIPVTGPDRPHYPGIMTWGDGQLVLVGGGRDGDSAHGSCGEPNPRPSQSRELWTGRVSVPAALEAPAYHPDRISLTTAANATAKLSWSATPGASYDIWRAPIYRSWDQPLVQDYTRIATVNGGTWTDPDAPVDTPWAYRVVRSGLSIDYGSLPAFNQPRRPHGMLASVESASRVTLRWAANDQSDVVGYNVYRKHGGGGTGKINAAPVAGTRFVDSAAGLGDGVLSSYYVRAVNKAGIESGASPLAWTAPDAPLQFSACVNPERNQATVRWQWPANRNVAGFEVYFNDHHENTNNYSAEQNAAWWAEWQPVTTSLIAAHEVTVNLPDPSKDYYFYGRAVNLLGQAGFFTDIASATDYRFLSAAPGVYEICDTIYRNGFGLVPRR